MRVNCLSYRHPNATGSYTTESFMKLMAFDVEDRMDLINQPLLMIAGEKADTLYMTEAAFAQASGTQDKEIYQIYALAFVIGKIIIFSIDR
ncbi:hypothetical protein [Selenomonas ruminantium]|uniref:hypothetical protein n=1 Tax=Selenomonas ruminantium TaxID=971 RepID=UPI0004789957|nr:hypothetical protein [Selenomonas ruminantium]